MQVLYRVLISAGFLLTVLAACGNSTASAPTDIYYQTALPVFTIRTPALFEATAVTGALHKLQDTNVSVQDRDAALATLQPFVPTLGPERLTAIAATVVARPKP